MVFAPKSVCKHKKSTKRTANPNMLLQIDLSILKYGSTAIPGMFFNRNFNLRGEAEKGSDQTQLALEELKLV